MSLITCKIEEEDVINALEEILEKNNSKYKKIENAQFKTFDSYAINHLFDVYKAANNLFHVQTIESWVSDLSEITRYAVMYELNHPANQPDADKINDKMETMEFVMNAFVKLNRALSGFADVTGTFLPE